MARDSDRQIEHDASPSKGTLRPLSIGIPQAALPFVLN